MNHQQEAALALARLNSRREFLRQSMTGLGAIALGSLGLGAGVIPNKQSKTQSPGLPHFSPKAKN
ncbi:MAG: sulfatase, partial [Bacteroidota bacterium]